MRRRFTVPSLAAAMVLSTIALPASGQEADGFALTVLHSNDGESALLPSSYDFTGDEDLFTLACPDGAPTSPFADVRPGNPHAGSIDCGSDRDIINGISATEFSPTGWISRGQVATFVLGVLKAADVEVPGVEGAPDFPDLQTDHGRSVHSTSIRRLAAAGIVVGRTDGTFGANDPVRRDQLATMVIGALAFSRGDDAVEPDGDSPFTDVMGGTHADNVVVALELGLVRGKTADQFAPGHLAARDQTATIVIGLLGRITGETVPAGGAARFVDFVKTLQAEGTGDDAGVVTISSGDNFLAGPEYSASVESFEDGGLFYDAEVFKGAGYDAMTIGNHEFDFGPAGLAQFIAAFDREIPFLSANLDFSDEDALAPLVADGSITPSTVVTVDGREVGIIGATTEVLRSVSAPGPDVIINQVLPAVTAQVAALEAAGVEIIILASHLQNLDNERELIGELSGVDAVIGGGGAEDLRDAYPFVIEDADGVEVPLVTTPGDYRDVGRLVLEFDAAGDLVAVGDDSALLAVPPYGPKDERIATTVEAPVAAALDELARTPVADNEVPLDARTATVRTRESNIANLLTDGMLRASRDRAVEYGVPVADVALQNGGGIRGNAIMTEDELSALFTFNTAPFGNRIAVDTITAAKLLELIEHGLSGLPAVEGRFGHWAGVEFSYDVSEPAGSRVVDAEVTRADGTTFVLVADGVLNADASDDITLVGLNFTLNCGDAYPFDGCDQEPRAAEFTELGLTDQQAFRNHLEAIEAVTSSNYPDLTVDFDRYNRYGPVGGNFLD